MLYEFKSKATGSVLMTGPVGERMLAIIGKAPGPRGIVTVAQLGPAIEALEQAVARERAERTEQSQDDDDEDRNDPDAVAKRRETVSFSARAWPLIEMFKAAQAADKDVTWGV